MRILVTGGGGFVGKYLVKSLLDKGNSVTIYDNFRSSTEDNILSLKRDGATIVKGNITDFESVLKAVKDVEFLIHLAAKISVPDSIKSPELTFAVNVTGSINVLRACVKQNVRNIIAASSAAVYGQPKDLPLTETSPTSSISPYGESKVTMEKHLRDFSNTYGLDTIALRFFNIYGKGQSDTYAGVITKFMNNISDNKPLVIFGDGSNTRDFISIDDVVNSIHNAMENIKGKKGNYYNIAMGKSVSIKELAELMLSISGKKLDIKYEPPKKGDIMFSQASIDLAQKELGFNPKIKLWDGIKKLLDS